jgi:hypothetical protein
MVPNPPQMGPDPHSARLRPPYGLLPDGGRFLGPTIASVIVILIRYPVGKTETILLVGARHAIVQMRCGTPLGGRLDLRAHAP